MLDSELLFVEPGFLAENWTSNMALSCAFWKEADREAQWFEWTTSCQQVFFIAVVPKMITKLIYIQMNARRRSDDCD